MNGSAHSWHSAVHTALRLATLGEMMIQNDSESGLVRNVGAMSESLTDVERKYHCGHVLGVLVLGFTSSSERCESTERGRLHEQFSKVGGRMCIRPESSRVGQHQCPKSSKIAIAVGKNYIGKCVAIGN